MTPVDADTIREAFRLTTRYKLSHWDSLIVSAALLAGCDTLHSEDMQDGLVIEEQLTVVNPFKEAVVGPSAPSPASAS